MWFSNCTPGCSSQGNEDFHSCQSLCMNVHSSLIDDNQRRKTKYASVGGWVYEEAHHTEEYCSARARDEPVQRATARMDRSERGKERERQGERERQRDRKEFHKGKLTSAFNTTQSLTEDGALAVWMNPVLSLLKSYYLKNIKAYLIRQKLKFYWILGL